MDSPNLSERLSARRIPAPEEDADAFDDCGAYACLRGARERGVMIDFRFLNGNREAFPYATLERVTYDPSEGLTLRFYGVRVSLRGRNFAAVPAAGASLLDAIHRHRVPWIREVEELRGKFLPADAVVVTRIEIREN